MQTPLLGIIITAKMHLKITTKLKGWARLINSRMPSSPIYTAQDDSIFFLFHDIWHHEQSAFHIFFYLFISLADWRLVMLYQSIMKLLAALFSLKPPKVIKKTSLIVALLLQTQRPSSLLHCRFLLGACTRPGLDTTLYSSNHSLALHWWIPAENVQQEMRRIWVCWS